MSNRLNLRALFFVFCIVNFGFVRSGDIIQKFTIDNKFLLEKNGDCGNYVNLKNDNYNKQGVLLIIKDTKDNLPFYDDNECPYYIVNKRQKSSLIDQLKNNESTKDLNFNRVIYDLRFIRKEHEEGCGIYHLKYGECKFSTQDNYFDLYEECYLNDIVQVYSLPNSINYVQKKSEQQNGLECGFYAVLNGILEVCGYSSVKIKNCSKIIKIFKNFLQNNNDLMMHIDYDQNIEFISEKAVQFLGDTLLSGDLDISEFLDENKIPDLLKDKNVGFTAISLPWQVLADWDKIDDKLEEEIDKFRDSNNSEYIVFYSTGGHWLVCVLRKKQIESKIDMDQIKEVEIQLEVTTYDSMNNKINFIQIEGIFARFFGKLLRIDQVVDNVYVDECCKKLNYDNTFVDDDNKEVNQKHAQKFYDCLQEKKKQLEKFSKETPEEFIKSLKKNDNKKQLWQTGEFKVFCAFALFVLVCFLHQYRIAQEDI